MLAIVGTVPDPDFPLLTGPARIEEGRIRLEGEKIPVNRGTPAMLAAALKACEVINSSGVLTCLVGDIGTGQGSRRLYEHLAQGLDWEGLKAFAFHYLQPDVDWHNRVLFAMEEMNPRPVLIADAGFMYAAKMSGQAAKYDLFTPDVGELAFLADEQAPHPFYTRGFILHEENRVPDLITRSYDHSNAARHLLVKGEKDYLVREGEIVDTVAEPIVEAMEAMGGTGDTLTGLVTALAAAGYDLGRACLTAARVNRLAGLKARINPASQVSDIIECIPDALDEVLSAGEFSAHVKP
ncbi:MAG: NAD(P)H-hydrate dehydratase [Desulfarculaceae bacterium]|jgi:hypothetical protein